MSHHVVVIDANGKIFGWYFVRPENIDRIEVSNGHRLIEVGRSPAIDETHVDLSSIEMGRIPTFIKRVDG